MAVLKTSYMGFELDCPLVVAASPLSREVADVQRLEDAGAGAVVLYSLFEEQCRQAISAGSVEWLSGDAGLLGEFHTTPEEYLDHIERVKRVVRIPIIASLNAAQPGPWLRYAARMEDAGADGIELNIYKVVADPTMTSAAVEDVYVEILEMVKSSVTIPVALKIGPYFTALASVAARFDEAGADALVLFNRFYQPTIDIERCQVVPTLEYSSRFESRLPLMWIAMLKGQVRANLAATTAIYTAGDVVRMIMAGADVTMVCSALLRHGVERLAEIRRSLEEWLDDHGYRSVDAIRGIMSCVHQRGSADFGRAGYAKVLNRYW
ncbi:MAG: dihydroorotate dehydrogenase-like protein [Candidatus Dadabacteria bacterium]|nr:MAG: dihydroorotate dehydrogenase-like protein [Candidatus Dadabacteria bacterium]